MQRLLGVKLAECHLQDLWFQAHSQAPHGAPAPNVAHKRHAAWHGTACMPEAQLSGESHMAGGMT